MGSTAQLGLLVFNQHSLLLFFFIVVIAAVMIIAIVLVLFTSAIIMLTDFLNIMVVIINIIFIIAILPLCKNNSKFKRIILLDCSDFVIWLPVFWEVHVKGRQNQKV